MKKLKNILVLTLALVLVLATAIPAFAASITINNASVGQTYRAYKIFDVVTNGNSYAYSIKEKITNDKGEKIDNPWFAVVKSYVEDPSYTAAQLPFSADFTKIIDGAVVITPIRTNNAQTNDAKAKHFANYLSSKVAGLALTKGTDYVEIKAEAPADNPTEETTSVTFDNLETGYYFVSSTLGSLCALHTAASTETITAKNTRPNISKTVDVHTASVGQQVTFTLTIQANKGADAVYTLEDIMDNSLTFDPTVANAFEITYGNIVEAQETEGQSNSQDVPQNMYTITKLSADPNDFKIEFSKDFTSTLTDQNSIKIIYTAILNEDAINSEFAKNKVNFTYKTIEKSAEVQIANHGFSLVKTGLGDVLLGSDKLAKFKLYSDEKCENEIKLIKTFYKNDDGSTSTTDFCYRPAKKTVTQNPDGSSTTTYEETLAEYIEAGVAKIDGLANGKYYLKEIEAPSGYNKVLTATEVEIKSADKFHQFNADKSAVTNLSEVVAVKNLQGALIPTTGGIGTTIFYVLGSILLIGAGVLLVTRKRMNTSK